MIDLVHCPCPECLHTQVCLHEPWVSYNVPHWEFTLWFHVTLFICVLECLGNFWLIWCLYLASLSSTCSLLVGDLTVNFKHVPCNATNKIDAVWDLHVAFIQKKLTFCVFACKRYSVISFRVALKESEVFDIIILHLWITSFLKIHDKILFISLL